MERAFPYRHFRPSQPDSSARQKILAQWRGWDGSAEEKARWPSAQSTCEVMPKVLKGLGLDRRLAETEILKVWKHLLDPNITDHAQPTGLHKGTLFVTVDSNAWLNEIVRYRRREILEKLQDSFGRDLVAKISFRSS